MNVQGIDWVGEIISIDDPLKLLRIKCKVPGLFSEEIEPELLPWFYPSNAISFSSAEGGTGSCDVPKVGTFVVIHFSTNDIYSGQYYSIPTINETLRNEILAQEYEGVHVMKVDYDEQLQIFYTPKQGVMIKLGTSYINIDSEHSIKIKTENKNTIELNNNGALSISCSGDVTLKTPKDVKVNCNNTILESGHIDLGEESSTEAVVFGTSFKPIFENHYHIGNMGAPTSSAIACNPMHTVPLSNECFVKGDANAPQYKVKTEKEKNARYFG